MDNNKGTVKWIVGLCVAVVVAVSGWTMTASLASRMEVMEEIKNNEAGLQANVSANNIRISVLENKYDSIATQLAEIKALLQAYARGK
jgi:Tfp pilus assembly protein PilO